MIITVSPVAYSICHKMLPTSTLISYFEIKTAFGVTCMEIYIYIRQKFSDIGPKQYSNAHFEDTVFAQAEL